MADYDMSHDDMVSFARAMYEIDWRYSDDAGEPVLAFFESPHKWNGEYQKWRELGGTLDRSCLDALDAALNPIPKDDDND